MILVTRPQPQGQILCQYLQDRGFEPVYLPVIDIQALPDLSHFANQLAELDHFDWAIFVSRSAVTCSQSLIHEHWPQWPSHPQIIAIGEGTAQALQAAQLPLPAIPGTWNSEGILALPQLQAIKGKKIAVFCGQGGREFLVPGLEERGAQVQRLVCYQRQLPKVDISVYLPLLKNNQLDALVCTSAEGVANLKTLFGEEGWPELKKIPLVLVSERIMIQAKELGFETCFLAQNASDESVAQALQTIRKKQ